MFICLLFLIISLCAFLSVLFSRHTAKYGKTAEAEILSVEKMIPTGLRSLLAVLSKKESAGMLTLSCDYILRIGFTDSSGKRHTPSVTVNAVMKIDGGERIPYYAKGDKITVRYNERFPEMVCIEDREIVSREKTAAKLVLWGFCALLSAAVMICLLYN